ncbi:MAG: oligoendopeptidase F [Candidatus Zixiibacteriota bacterium]
MSKNNHQPIIGFFIGLLLSVIIIAPSFAEVQKLAQRDDIDNKYKWNLEKIFPTIEDWEKDFQYVKDNYLKIEEYQNHLAESADNLYECLKLKEEMNIIVDNLYSYASMKQSEDNRNSTVQELVGRIGSLYSEVDRASSFIHSELLEIDSDRLHQFIDEKKELEEYRFYFDDLIRQKKFILSPKEEAILALVSPMSRTAGRSFSMLTNADMSYGYIYDEDSNKVELNEERYEKFRHSLDRRVRRDNHETYFGKINEYSNTIATTLGGAMIKDYFFMKARGYDDCLQRSLFTNNIPTSVFYNLIETVDNNLEPLHKWAELKKKVLGYDTLYPYDLYVDLMPLPQKQYTWEEAKEVSIEGLSALGEKYMNDYKNGLNSGWIDVFQNEGKSSGAYSGGTYTSDPYILLNFDGTLNWIFTLVHEMGHSMQSYYVQRNEPYIYSDYTTFVAEVASTCNESLLIKNLLDKTKDRKERIALLNYYIYQIRTTFFRQTMFAEFELAIHKHIENGGAFSDDFFKKTFADIYQKYWGEALYVDDLGSLLGMVIPHFYGQYYVYQYSTSYAAAELISQKIHDGDEVYADRYLKFLGTGSSNYPVEVLKEAGVDMTTPEPFLHTINLFSSLVDELEKLLKEEGVIKD